MMIFIKILYNTKEINAMVHTSGEFHGIALTESAFDKEVVQNSQRQPVLVEIGGGWCEDCHEIAANGVLDRIAQEGHVRVVIFDASANQASQAYFVAHPEEIENARQRGYTGPVGPPLLAGVATLIDHNINAYPTFLLVDKGRMRKFY